MPTTDSSLVSALLVNVSNKKMYDARMFATIKLLEYIEDQLKEITGVVSAKLLAQDPDWSKLFDKKFVRFGGFERARYLPQAGDFDIELWEAGQKISLNLSIFRCGSSQILKSPNRLVE